MFCRGRGPEDEDQMVKAIWPHDWETAKMFLVKLGYQDAKEYYICLDDSHKRHWDIMDKETDTCRHCGQKGQLKYYYLGLEGKVTVGVKSRNVPQNVWSLARKGTLVGKRKGMAC